MRRVTILIKGVVQGVFFRKHVKALALKLGLQGFVANVGKNVEAVFEGEDEKVADMLEFCALGPEDAVVREISVTEETVLGNFDSFEIKR